MTATELSEVVRDHHGRISGIETPIKPPANVEVYVDVNDALEHVRSDALALGKLAGHQEAMAANADYVAAVEASLQDIAQRAADASVAIGFDQGLEAGSAIAQPLADAIWELAIKTVAPDIWNAAWNTAWNRAFTNAVEVTAGEFFEGGRRFEREHGPLLATTTLNVTIHNHNAEVPHNAGQRRQDLPYRRNKPRHSQQTLQPPNGDK
jgi:hypothetical protein